MVGEEISPLPTGIDQQPGSEMSLALCVAGEDRKRKVGKQPPLGKPKAKANTKGEPKKKKPKTRSAAMSSQAEGGEEEEGEEDDDDDDDDDDKACEGKDHDEKCADGNDVEEKNKQKTVASQSKSQRRWRQEEGCFQRKEVPGVVPRVAWRLERALCIIEQKWGYRLCTCSCGEIRFRKVVTEYAINVDFEDEERGEAESPRAP